jgi:hypothetical protein
VNPADLKLGVFTRRVVAIAEPGRAFAALEDDFHHFHAEIAHDGGRVTAVAGQALRYPRSSCPEARERLQQFVGLALDAASTGIDATWQCTHVYELVRLAIAQARRQRDDAFRQRGGERCGAREYEIRVPDRVARRTQAEIRRDGKTVLTWQIEGSLIVAPERFAGFDIYGRSRWPDGLDADQLEAAMLLRRGAWLSIARGIYATGVDAHGAPTGLKFKLNSPVSGACYSYQPQVEAGAKSLRLANRRDFTDRPGELLAELERPPHAPFTLKVPAA